MHAPRIAAAWNEVRTSTTQMILQNQNVRQVLAFTNRKVRARFLCANAQTTMTTPTCGCTCISSQGDACVSELPCLPEKNDKIMQMQFLQPEFT